MEILNSDHLIKVLRPLITRVISRWRQKEQAERMTNLIIELLVFAYRQGTTVGSDMESDSKMKHSRFVINPKKVSMETRPLSDIENDMIAEFMDARASEPDTL